LVDETAGFFRASGVPPFAHHPLPPQFVASELQALRGLPSDRAQKAIQNFAAVFDNDAKTVVQRQAENVLRGRASGREGAEVAANGTMSGVRPRAKPTPPPSVGPQAGTAGAAAAQANPLPQRIPFARDAGGGRFELGGNGFWLPTQDQADVLAGVNAVAQGYAGPIGFVNDRAGKGLVLADRNGRPVVEGGAPVHYSWQQLREMAPLGIVQRDRWTQDPIIRKFLDTADRPYGVVTLHHTGSRETPQQVYDQHMDKLKGWDRVQRKVRERLGFVPAYKDYGDVGYHFLIGEDGRIYEGRSLEFEGAHVSRHNPGNLGIAVLGDNSTEALNAAQLRALTHLIRSLNSRLRIEPNPRGGGYGNAGYVYTHGQFDPNKAEELMGAERQLDELMRKVQPAYR
jgi:hypothetical protein